jgi:hypothetical protein
MPTRSSKKPKREGTPHDFTVNARRVVEQAIGEKLSREPLNDPNAHSCEAEGDCRRAATARWKRR